MRKLLLGCGVALIALTAMASPAAAATFRCNETVTGGTFDKVSVPDYGSCTLINSTVTGDVFAGTGTYFQATNTDIAGQVRAIKAQTLFIDNETTVARDIKSLASAQVFIFNAAAGRGIIVDDTLEAVHLCGNHVVKGGIQVTDSASDILVGDPSADGCSGNTIDAGNLQVNRNLPEVEFVVRGNTVTAGTFEVIKNLGSAEKFIEDNTGSAGKQADCRSNDGTVTVGGNNGWKKRTGQCKVVLTCTEELTGIDVDDVAVPAGGACTLFDARISGDVSALDGAYLQAARSNIGGKVRATRAQTLFLDSQTNVARDVKTSDTVQVYVYNATIGTGLAVDDTTEVVQLCGTTITKGNMTLTDSRSDILVGLPVSDCFGNTVSEGNMSIERNFADVEFEVNGNTITLGSLKIARNKGPVEKSVKDNIGGGSLDCADNQLPFSAVGNSFLTITGQCIEV